MQMKGFVNYLRLIVRFIRTCILRIFVESMKNHDVRNHDVTLR